MDHGEQDQDDQAAGGHDQVPPEHAFFDGLF